MKRPAKTLVSTKIEANYGKIYRTNDLHDLSYIFFPNKNAKELRIAFMLIFLAIKHSQAGKMSSLEIENIRVQQKRRVSQKTLWKARAVMSRIGLIERRDGLYWKFSSRFRKSFLNLADRIQQLSIPTGEKNQGKREWFLLYYE